MILSQDDIHAAVDPIENVKRRKVIGRPAAEEAKRMINDRWIRVEKKEKIKPF